MIPNNDPLYKTSQSKIQRFTPFTDNIKKEKEDLNKVKRQNRDDKVSRQSFPHSGQSEMHWNTVTNKMDKNLSKAQIEDRIKSIEDSEEGKTTDHKYKIVDEKLIKSFEGFVINKNIFEGCDCDDCDCDKSTDPMMSNQVDYENTTHETSYMFFGNLETIHNMCTQMMEMDNSQINTLLNDGHNWAEDHMSVAKENVSHVFNFLSNKEVSEGMDSDMGSHNENYMFFANIESICRMVGKLLEFNQMEIDNVLGEGHDWAEDHISAAKENVQQVHDWLQNELH